MDKELTETLADWDAFSLTCNVDLTDLTLNRTESVVFSADGRPFLFDSENEKFWLMDPVAPENEESMEWIDDNVTRKMPEFAAFFINDPLLDRIRHACVFMLDEEIEDCQLRKGVSATAERFSLHPLKQPSEGRRPWVSIREFTPTINIVDGDRIRFGLTYDNIDNNDNIIERRMVSVLSLPAEKLHHYFERELKSSASRLRAIAWAGNAEVVNRAVDYLSSKKEPSNHIAAALILRSDFHKDEVSELAHRLVDEFTEKDIDSAIKALPKPPEAVVSAVNALLCDHDSEIAFGPKRSRVRI